LYIDVTYPRLHHPPVTEKSWEQPFEGDAAQGLWSHLETFFTPTNHRVYGHYAAVVQSSGMGKSRTVDELGKDHFTISLVLREADSTGAWPISLELNVR
jgi:hypothetical protein